MAHFVGQMFAAEALVVAQVCPNVLAGDDLAAGRHDPQLRADDRPGARPLRLGRSLQPPDRAVHPSRDRADRLRTGVVLGKTAKQVYGLDV